MDKKQLEKLAQILLPEIGKEARDYFEIYKRRNMPEGAKVTRYAPSPTGFQHLGGVFSAIISERIAHQSGGIFYLRIEDTDKKREVEGAIEDTINIMSLFNIQFDEGITGSFAEKGQYGPYKQGERKEIYQCFAKELIRKDLAYPCFCTEEALGELRKNQETLKATTGYYGKWAVHRNMDFDDIMKELEAGKPYVIRLKSPGSSENRIKVEDLIKGAIELPENDQDIVILKSDGIPTYHFAHAVDDYLMGTTNVIRGEEWFPSTPIHLQLFQVLGFPAPQYAHIPTMMKMDGNSRRKLSKRKDAEMAISFYNKEGYPYEAVIEYLLNIINSNFQDWRKENPKAFYGEFKIQLEKMSQSGALFDLDKLNDISRDLIGSKTNEEVYAEYIKWCEKYDEEMLEKLKTQKEYVLNLLNIDRNIPNPRKDYCKWSEVKYYISYFFNDFFIESIKNGYELPERVDIENAKTVIKEYINIYSEEDDQTTWFAKVKEFSNVLGYTKDNKTYKKNPDNFKGTLADVAAVIRTVLTNRKNTPDLHAIMKVLGEEEVFRRFSIFI